MKENRIWWKPVNLHVPRGFEIELERESAKRMFDIKVLPEAQENMNRRGEEEARKYGYKPIQPYIFEGDSALIRQINLKNGNEISLTLAELAGRIPDFSKSNPLIYVTNHIDTPIQKYVLMELFSLWDFNSECFEDYKK
jgi:hypothetical protein